MGAAVTEPLFEHCGGFLSCFFFFSPPEFVADVWSVWACF
jgi:hypothetical protein